jgi:hypothetical protein
MLCPKICLLTISYIWKVNMYLIPNVYVRKKNIFSYQPLQLRDENVVIMLRKGM